MTAKKIPLAIPLIIHDATLSSHRRVIFIERASYVAASIMSNVSLLRLHIRMKSWLRTYSNDDQRNICCIRCANICACILRVRVPTKTEMRRACHNPARLRFFSPFDVLRDLRISARHSPRWILYYLLRSCTDTWTMSLIVSLIHY